MLNIALIIQALLMYCVYVLCNDNYRVLLVKVMRGSVCGGIHLSPEGFSMLSKVGQKNPITKAV